MRDEADILLAFCRREWEQAIQSENQRSTITYLIAFIAAGALAVAANLGFGRGVLLMGLLLIGLGSFGALSCVKLYERWHLHRVRAGLFRERIDEFFPDAKLEKLRNEAEVRHSKVFPVLMDYPRLHQLWVVFHTAIALLGGVLAVLAFVD